MVIFEDLIDTRLIGFAQHDRGFETTMVSVRRIVHSPTLRHIALAVHLEPQFAYLIALDRQEVQRIHRTCYGRQLIAYEHQ